MHLLRAKLAGNIVVEFLPPKKPSNKVVIVCDGMPTEPSKKKYLEFFSRKGYWATHPRYRGTWESGGQFLDHNPTDDILDVIKSIPMGFKSIWDGIEYRVNPEKVLVVGSSFGGTAALLASEFEDVDKVIAISPVVDWTKESPDEPMDWLEEIVKEGYGDAYRFKHEDWLRLSRGEFFQPVSKIDTLPAEKIFLIHAEDDETVPVQPSKDFVKQINCKHYFFKTGGHSLMQKCMNPFFARRLWRFIES